MRPEIKTKALEITLASISALIFSSALVYALWMVRILLIEVFK